jgi:hypothetical protein
MMSAVVNRKDADSLGSHAVGRVYDVQINASTLMRQVPAFCGRIRRDVTKLGW